MNTNDYEKTQTTLIRFSTSPAQKNISKQRPRLTIQQQLEHFDLDMKYGPCYGISRKDRYQRAQHLGLNPPRELEPYLDSDNVYEQYKFL